MKKKIVFVCLFLFIIFFTSRFVKYIPSVYQYFFHKEITLKTNELKQINVLLLGIGGGRHDGPLLTDTIIFANIDLQNKSVHLISIPRDLWINDLQAKINTAYAYGESKKQGGGLLLTKRVVQQVVGQEIDYGFRIDFTGFIKAVDAIGGLDITVDRAFADSEYPLSGKEQDACGFEGEEFEKRATAEAQIEAFPCRYETLQFPAGIQHMDGETALKFVRSRHAKGPEGTDFARSKRQEKVIRALKEKLLSAGTLLNPIKLYDLYEIVKASIDMDIKEDEFDDFAKLAQQMKDAAIESTVLDAGDEKTQAAGLLLNPPVSETYDYQWVIIPRLGADNFTEIHAHVSCVLSGSKKCVITPLPTESN